MIQTLAPNHARLVLLFCLTQDIDDAVRRAARDFVARLATSRDWMLGPPAFVDNIEWPDDDSLGDLPAETLNGYLEIYSAFPPWSLPREIDLQHLEEVTALLAALASFSRERSLDFEVYLDGDITGYVENGQLDQGLAEVFLGEWRRGLGLVP